MAVLLLTDTEDAVGVETVPKANGGFPSSVKKELRGTANADDSCSVSIFVSVEFEAACSAGIEIDGNANDGLPSSVKNVLRGATKVDGVCSRGTSVSFAIDVACSAVADGIEGYENEGFPSSVKNVLRGETPIEAVVSSVMGISLAVELGSMAGEDDIVGKVKGTGGNVKDGFPSSVKKAVEGVASSSCNVVFSSTAGMSLGVSKVCF